MPALCHTKRLKCTSLQQVCSSSFMDCCHHVRLAHSRNVLIMKACSSSSSLFDWQSRWGYCYLAHTVLFLWWRYQVAYSPNAFLILLSLLSEKGTAVVKEAVYLVTWTTAKSSWAQSRQFHCSDAGLRVPRRAKLYWVWRGELNMSRHVLLTWTLMQQASQAVTSWSGGCEKSSQGFGWVMRW